MDEKLPYLLKASIVAVIRTEAGGELKKNYEAVFSVDEEGAKMPWFVLTNFLAPKFLTEQLGPQGQGWVKIYEARTIKIINREKPGDVSIIPLRVMTADQLDAHISRWELPVVQSDFHDLATARRFVKLFQADPVGYQVQYKDYMEGKGRKYPELDKFRKTFESSSPALDKEFAGLETDLSKNPPAIETKKNPFGNAAQVTPSPEEASALATEAGESQVDPDSVPDEGPVSAPPVPQEAKKQPVSTGSAPVEDPFKGV